jgi:2-polyprenyl-6-methoxyphenol hydroxylase-like FAD-dependent oxidoreductase
LRKSDHKRRAIVIGGSISGLFAALVLLRRGWQVDVFERSTVALAGRGAGIVAQPELRRALAEAGIGDIGAVGVEVESRLLLDRDGRRLLEHRCPQTVTSWERVHGLLCNALGDTLYHAGSELSSIETKEGEAIAHFADGTALTADLVVGADGSRSTVREQLFPEARLEYAGYIAWRALIDEAVFPPGLHREIFWHMAFGLPPGEQFIGYPVTGANDSMTPGELRYNVVWYRPAEEKTELRLLLTDSAGREHQLTIPPPLIRDEIRKDMRSASRRLLAPQFQAVVELTREPFLQPIYDLESKRIAAGHVAVVGDAGFVARPHVAAGVIKAADDVLSLADALDAETDIATALRRYQAERLPVGQRIVARAREMGANYRHSTGNEQRKSGTDEGYARAVLEDTALTTFLNDDC